MPLDDDAFRGLTAAWHLAAVERRYAYGFTWLGRSIFQFPQDIYAAQEIIWKVRPTLILETGIAHGGAPSLRRPWAGPAAR